MFNEYFVELLGLIGVLFVWVRGGGFECFKIFWGVCGVVGYCGVDSWNLFFVGGKNEGYVEVELLVEGLG